MTTTTNFFKTDLLLLMLAVSPILYLYWLWPTVPDTVPLHWNFKGEVDNYGSKQVLFWTVAGLNGFVYVLFLVLPRIAARKQELQAMGVKYQRIRLVLQLFVAALSVVIILMATGKTSWHQDYLLGGCLLLFMLLFGNYVGSIRPNHFVGIRTPWTLQSDVVWRKTHRLTSRLLLAGAALGTLMLALLPTPWGLTSVIVTMTTAVVLPAVYSYFLFQQEPNKNDR